MPLFNYLKNNISILDLISEYVPLKVAGNYWKGPCPFHYEKEASFTVSPDKQIFYCFGCHAKGDIVSFIAQKENLSQIEAAKYLIEKYGIDLPSEIKDKFFNKFDSRFAAKDNYFGVCKFFSSWLNGKLLESQSALQYLVDRNIDKVDIEYFKIGYFPGGVKNIGSMLRQANSLGFLVKDFVEAGILIQGHSVLYSPFEERIIFPIHDIMSRCCGFGGRVFRKEDTRAKYYNSKESLWFLKGKLLFGLDLAKSHMQEKKDVFLVEGYTDCVSMAKYRYKNVVATLGTACTEAHLRMLSRFVYTVNVVYDGDDAGQKAMLRLVGLCWDVDLELKIVTLPAKIDPADFLEKNGSLDSLLSSTKSVFEFFIDITLVNFSENVLSKQMVAGRKVLQLIAKINDPLKREILVQRAAKYMGISSTSLNSMIFGERSRLIVDSKIVGNKLVDSDIVAKDGLVVPVLEERIFSAIINNLGKEELFVPQDLRRYFSDYIQVLLKRVDDFVGENNDNTARSTRLLVEFLEQENKDWVTACSLKYDSNISKDAFDELLMLFSKKNWKQIVQDVKFKIQDAKNGGNDERVKKLLELFTRLKSGIETRGLI